MIDHLNVTESHLLCFVQGTTLHIAFTVQMICANCFIHICRCVSWVSNPVALGLQTEGLPMTQNQLCVYRSWMSRDWGFLWPCVWALQCLCEVCYVALTRGTQCRGTSCSYFLCFVDRPSLNNPCK